MADKELQGVQAGKSAPLDTDLLVEKWLEEYFPDSTISRDSAGWQHILNAAAELKRRLKGA